jgi:spore germination protein PE
VAIAVKREIPIYRGDEGDFDRYAIFRRPIPLPTLHPDFQIQYVNEIPAIRVDRIHLDIIGFSGVLQIGSCGSIQTEDRIKQFRQVLPESAALQRTSPQ